MPHYGRSSRIVWLNLMLLAAFAGCGGSGDGKQPTAAAISGQGGTDPTTGGGQGTSGQKSASDPLHPVVLIEIASLGNITVRLDVEKAPLTVSNFLSYVNAGHYDQTIVHQVYKGQGFLAGGYGANMVEKPGRTPVRNEAHNGLKNRRGTISMVRLPDAIDSARCQFFINVADNPNLDFRERTTEGYGYCVFGEVIEDGMAVGDTIGNVHVHDTKDLDRTPVQPIVVKSIRQIR
jgi:peptidyl-prolyl cis-trans isomerase B (cyclophilin B)